MAERRKLTFDQWLRELTGRRPAPPAGQEQPEDAQQPPRQPEPASDMNAFIRAAGRRRRLR